MAFRRLRQIRQAEIGAETKQKPLNPNPETRNPKPETLEPKCFAEASPPAHRSPDQGKRIIRESSRLTYLKGPSTPYWLYFGSSVVYKCPLCGTLGPCGYPKLRQWVLQRHQKPWRRTARTLRVSPCQTAIVKGLVFVVSLEIQGLGLLKGSGDKVGL